MELKKMKVKDVVQSDEFRRLMSEQLQREEHTQREAALRVVKWGGRLKRSVIDSLRDKGVLNAADMTRLFKAVLNKSLAGFSSTERSYVYDVGMKVFRQTVVKLRKQEGGNDGSGETEV